MFPEFDDDERASLLDLARGALEQGVRTGERLQPEPALASRFPEAPIATFVTLHLHGQLNGCIGTIEPRRAICHDISHNAFEAALNDPRFSPLSREQLAHVDVHISVLSPLQTMEVEDEHDLREQVRPGRDGLVLRAGTRRATFLPSVWEKLPDPDDFVEHLKRKARIGPLEWPDQLRVFRYEVVDFSG